MYGVRFGDRELRFDDLDIAVKCAQVRVNATLVYPSVIHHDFHTLARVIDLAKNGAILKCPEFPNETFRLKSSKFNFEIATTPPLTDTFAQHIYLANQTGATNAQRS